VDGLPFVNFAKNNLNNNHPNQGKLVLIVVENSLTLIVFVRTLRNGTRLMSIREEC